MSKLKRILLHSLLLACLAVMPVSVFGVMPGSNGSGEHPEERASPKTEQPKADEILPRAEKVASRYNFGVYYGRPYGRAYNYRPYYYYYPYRPYYYRQYNYSYRPYYGW